MLATDPGKKWHRRDDGRRPELWGVTPGGFTKNIGEVPSGSLKGSTVYTTALKSFALMLTAEPYAQVMKPSPLVMFINDPPEKAKAGVETFAFSGFAAAPPHDLDSIRAVAWDDARPVELVQAEPALAYADRIGAEKYTPVMIQDARLMLAHATKLVIAKLAGILLIMQDLNLRVEGHTDATGPYDYNLRLSEDRARSVVQFLAEQGIAATRMVAEGYGPDRPIASNDTGEGRSRNRRVEIVIAGGMVAEAPAAP